MTAWDDNERRRWLSASDKMEPPLDQKVIKTMRLTRHYNYKTYIPHSAIVPSGRHVSHHREALGHIQIDAIFLKEN